ncbi:MAG: 5-formyltetrahydrofolate cyclo-ligase [Nostocoides sp.]
MTRVSPTAKAEVRSALRARRRTIAADRDLAVDDEALAEHGLAAVVERGLGPGSTVTLYESRAVEPRTTALTAALQGHGIRVLWPITLPDLDLDWQDAADPDRTPLGKDAIALADLAFIPGLAVDPTGTRLGQGGGCYDKALPRGRAGVDVVCLLHPGEYGEPPLPRETHDRPVGWVLTADAVCRVAGFRG